MRISPVVRKIGAGKGEGEDPTGVKREDAIGVKREDLTGVKREDATVVKSRRQKTAIRGAPQRNPGQVNMSIS